MSQADKGYAFEKKILNVSVKFSLCDLFRKVSPVILCLQNRHDSFFVSSICFHCIWYILSTANGFYETSGKHSY